MTTDHRKLIDEVRASVERHTSGARRDRLLARLDEVDKAHGTHKFGDRLKALIEEIEVDTAEIAPFVSRLSSLLP
jgi:hypothetical protein